MSRNHNLFLQEMVGIGQVLPCFCWFKESLRPVSKSQALYTRNCCIQKGSLLLLFKITSILMKTPSDEDEVALDSLYEKYRSSDFLCSRNYQCKIADLHFFKKQYAENYPLVDLLKFDYRTVKLDEKFKVFYDEWPCNIYIKNFAATIIKGHHLKRNIYLQIGLFDLIWKVFVTIFNLTSKKNKKLKFFAESILVSINCDQRLPLDKITYFDDIVIEFDGVDMVEYRLKTCYFVNVHVWKNKIMLPAWINVQLLQFIVFFLPVFSLISTVCQDISVVNNSNCAS